MWGVGIYGFYLTFFCNPVFGNIDLIEINRIECMLECFCDAERWM